MDKSPLITKLLQIKHWTKTLNIVINNKLKIKQIATNLLDIHK